MPSSSCCRGPHQPPFSQLIAGILFGFWVKRLVVSAQLVDLRAPHGLIKEPDRLDDARPAHLGHSPVELLFFDRADDAKPARVISIDPGANRSYHYWDIFVPGVRAGQTVCLSGRWPIRSRRRPAI